MKLKNNGITLISLVVTVIVLLILAGISIAQLTGNGLFQNAKLAKEKSEEAEAKENATLGDYENLIGDTIDNNRDTVTISKEEYESLKPNSITAESILMESSNNTLNVGTLNLKNFTNKFSDNFEKYFSYDEINGNLTCQKDGWYFTELKVVVTQNYSWSGSSVSLYINDVLVTSAIALAGKSGSYDRDANAFSVFLKQGDVIKISGVISNANANENNFIVKVIKL